MKFLLIALIAFVSAPAFADSESVQEDVRVTTTDVNTPVPKSLEGATILVKTKDGAIHEMRIEDYKVVPRKQQLKVTERTITKKQQAVAPVIVQEKVDSRRKNTVFLDVRKDFVRLEKQVQASPTETQVRIDSRRDAVVGLNYMRHGLLFEQSAIGVGIDTNATLRLMGGVSF